MELHVVRGLSVASCFNTNIDMITAVGGVLGGERVGMALVSSVSERKVWAA
jgi:hypothetical protein